MDPARADRRYAHGRMPRYTDRRGAWLTHLDSNGNAKGQIHLDTISVTERHAQAEVDTCVDCRTHPGPSDNRAANAR
jgi:hypothetical protein